MKQFNLYRCRKSFWEQRPACIDEPYRGHDGAHQQFMPTGVVIAAEAKEEEPPYKHWEFIGKIKQPNPTFKALFNPKKIQYESPADEASRVCQTKGSC